MDDTSTTAHWCDVEVDFLGEPTTFRIDYEQKGRHVHVRRVRLWTLVNDHFLDLYSETRPGAVWYALTSGQLRYLERLVRERFVEES